MLSIQIITDHPRHRSGEIVSLRADGSIITGQAKAATEASLVIRSSRPTRLISAKGATASLVPGWDGTLGYSLFRLDLKVNAPGPLRVELELAPPPAVPLPSTTDQIARFQRDYLARSSRFPDSPAKYVLWQQATRQRLIELLMAGVTPRRSTGSRRITETHDLGDYVVERFEHQSMPDRAHHALLSIPKGIAPGATVPLLIAVHGHETTWGGVDLNAFNEGHNDDFCGYFARRGWAVLQPATMDHRLQHDGWTLQGEWTWDILTALDRALEHPAIIPARVAVCGLSTGAHLAMNLLALDDRIRAGVVGCVFSTWHHVRTRLSVPPHCDCGITAQLGPHLEECDWLALAAPKPVQLQHGRADSCFFPGADPVKLQLDWNTGVLPSEEYEVALNEVRRAWHIAGRGDAVAQHYHDGPHRVDAAAAFKFLDEFL